MTTIPTFEISDMDPSTLDDKMELASSPFKQADDLDFDLDPMRDPSVEPMQDSMIDDTTERGDHAEYLMQGDDEVLFQDDDMLDEEHNDHNYQDQANDYNMEAGEPPRDVDEDEDILYEDEDETTVIRYDPPEDVELDSTEHQQAREAPLDFENNEDAENERFLPVQTEQGQIAAEDFSQDLDDNQGVPQTDDLGDLPLGDSDGLIHLELPAEYSQTFVQDGDITAGTGDPIPVEDQQAPQAKRNLDGFSTLEHENQALTSGIDDNIPDLNPKLADATGEGTAGTEAGLLEGKAEPSHGESTSVDLSESNLHPVKIAYLGEEMCLFPPSSTEESSTFFLSESTLAFDSLDKLLAACREILAGSIGDDDELVLDIASLGLHICEDSKYAAQISLSQILDVYMALCHNEETEQIQPLYCTLSSRVCLASQHAYLTAVAGQGKTFSEIAADYVDSPFEEEQDNDEIAPQVQNRTAQEQEKEAEIRIHDHALAEESSPILDAEAKEVEASTETADITTGVSDSHVGDVPQDLNLSHTLIANPPEAETQTIAHQNISTDHAPSVAAAGQADAGGGEGEIEATWLDEQEVDATGNEDRLEAPNLSNLQEEQYEAETNSSHTLQADPNLDADELLAHGQYEEDIFESTLIDNTEVAKTDGEDEQAGAYEYDTYSDEELFANEDVEPVTLDDDGNHASISSKEPTHAESHDTTNSLNEGEPDLGKDDSEEAQAISKLTNGRNPGRGASSAQAATDPAPETPTKSKSIKRKVFDDENDPDFLDLSTPEPKRRRPS